MRILMAFVLATALTGVASADDQHKEKVKVEGRDPVTGEKVKVKSRSKVEADGDYKEKTTEKVGDTKTKRKVKVEPDGDVKVKEKVDK